jgi:hypothetical protein
MPADEVLTNDSQILERELAMATDEEREKPQDVKHEGDHEARSWPDEPARSITCRADGLLAKDSMHKG